VSATSVINRIGSASMGSTTNRQRQTINVARRFCAPGQRDAKPGAAYDQYQGTLTIADRFYYVVISHRAKPVHMPRRAHFATIAKRKRFGRGSAGACLIVNGFFVEVIKDPLAHYMKQYGHHFWRSCKSCVDEGIYEKCACHDSQLYHIEPGAKPILVRECPDEKTMELCRYSSTNRCNRGIECFFAHSMIELDAWKMYTINEIESDDIIDKSREVAKEVEKEAEKEWVSNGGGGTEQAAVAQSFALKHRWICAICSKNGQQVARRGKTQYCAAGRNAHAWRDPILLCFVERWNIVRDLQAVFAKTTVGLPQTFVVCKNIRDKNKCDYGDVCQFSHSEEECKVWNYMKENNVKSLKQLYTKLMK